MPENLDYNMDMLRLATAGSVDDGKSTLIGRLLYDSKSIFEDQWEALESTSRNRGDEEVNLALLTDGLRAEREQGITIDVAYRYFATPRRKFIIADTPGHEQYTRNMVTGASTADLAIILIDARKGVLVQSRRHAFISSMLQIPHMVVAINKMDLVDYSEERYDEIIRDFNAFAGRMDVDDITFIPISALKGDNIVNKNDRMPWYKGATLLHHLEHVKMGSRRNMTDFRFPVQYVIRPDQDFRGYAGQIASGTIKAGEEVMILPSKQISRIKSIKKPDGDTDYAATSDPVVMTITDEIDISRGDMIVRKNNVPRIETVFEATLCWMNKEPMMPGKTCRLMHTTRQTQAVITDLVHRININSLHRDQADMLHLNDIGRVRIKTAGPLFFDSYKLNNSTGSFILIDPSTNLTIGAGMIRSSSTLGPKGIDRQDKWDETDADTPADTLVSPNVTWETWNITREEREKRNGHKAMVLWFAGISGAGKSTIAKALEKKLWKEGKKTMLLDGDQLRHGLCGDLGFGADDRKENVRRAGEAARLFFEHGNIVLCTFVSPYRRDRQAIKQMFPPDRFFEIQVLCRPETAWKRDPKGLYARAKKGEIRELTGYDAVFEESENADVTLNTDSGSPDELMDRLYIMISDYLQV